ncbi:hypothetical protein BC628DRAFT_1327933 [Trametes gibbosa]|nr:hypothetical protein BC628DRAFT_1327933 [Trametes gibbosa]
MARLRRDTQESARSTLHRPLRVVASGTLFLTNNLALPVHPEANSVVRAHSVSRVRGGSASTCLSIVAQFPAVDATLVAPLGGNDEGRMVINELEQERVSTRFSKIWPEAGVPSAWVLHADDTGSRTVINNNPLPDITHEEFISLLGPLLVPENYAYLNAALPSTPPATVQQTQTNGALAPANIAQSRSSTSGTRPTINSPAPIDWIHFEGRSVKTTLSNIMGLDGLARERKWRSHCVISVDVGRRARQGVEALIPHADVIFLNNYYARTHSPQYAASPRAFLLSLTSIAPRHALLVAHWGTDGAAVLSIPTREYFQSTGWVDTSTPTPAPEPVRASPSQTARAGEADMQSVRTGSDFWAGAGNHTESSSTFTADLLTSTPPRPGRGGKSPEETPRLSKHETRTRNGKRATHRSRGRDSGDSGDSSDSEGTQIAGHSGGLRQSPDPPRARPLPTANEVVDEVGAQDAFVAGMMWALSRRLLPGEPYTPAAVPSDGTAADADRERGRWRLEECLRFATELAGRKGRRKGWSGLADEMAKAGWFDL